MSSPDLLDYKSDATPLRILWIQPSGLMLTSSFMLWLESSKYEKMTSYQVRIEKAEA